MFDRTRLFSREDDAYARALLEDRALAAEQRRADEKERRKKLNSKYRQSDGKIKIEGMGTYKETDDGYVNSKGQKRTTDQMFELADIQERYKKEKEQSDKDNAWNKVLLEETGGAAKDVGMGMLAGIQQAGGKVADTAIKGGGILDEVANQWTAFARNEDSSITDQRRVGNIQRSEDLRNWIKGRKDITGQNLSGTKDIGVQDLKDDPLRKGMELAGEGLDVGLGATMFANPASLARGGVARRPTGLSIRKGTDLGDAAKTSVRDSAFFGGMDAAQVGMSTYGETGNVGEAVKEGVVAGGTSALLQGGMEMGAYGAGRGIRRLKDGRKTDDPNVTDEVADGIGSLVDELDSIQANNIATGGLRDNFRATRAELDKKLAQHKKELNRQGITFNTALSDVENRLQSLDNPEYMAKHGLDNREAGEQRYNELTQDPTQIPGVPEATRALNEAETQIEYYNELRADDPVARKVDEIRERIARIESAMQEDVGYLARMGDDETIDLDSVALNDMVSSRTSEYTKRIADEEAKIQEILERDPEGAANFQMLEQSERTVLEQRDMAQQQIDTIMSDVEANARAEAEQIAQEPNPEAIERHRESLEYQKQNLERAIEDAKKRADNPNLTMKHVNEELRALQTGNHPLVLEGASEKKIADKYIELNKEKHTQSAKEISESDPKIEKTVAQEETVLTETLQEVATAKIGLGAKIGRAWSQPANLLRHAGYNKLADMRSDGIIAHNRTAHDIKNTLKGWAKEAKGNKSETLFNAANGSEASYRALTPGGRKVIDAWRKEAYDLGLKMGLPKEILERGNYIPHLFTDIKNNPRLLDLQKKLVQAQKKASDGKLTGKELEKNKSHIQLLKDSIREITDNPGIVTAEDFIQETGGFNNRFLKERTDAEGYEQNFWKAVDAYMHAANTKVNLEPVMEEFAKAKRITPEKGMEKFLQGEIDKMRGTKHDWDRNLDDLFNGLTSELPGSNLTNNAGTKSLRGFRNAMSLSHIGFSATSTINTLAQAAIMPGSLNIDGSMYGMYKAMTLTGKLAKNKLSGKETEQFKHMARMGVFEGSSHILPDKLMNKYADNFNKTAFSGITGADRFLRMATYEGAMLKGERMGLKDMDLERYVYERVNEVNQNFSKIETPHAFRSQVAKTMGSMITFVPGMIVRSAEIGATSIKGGADIIGKTATGKKITRAEFMKDVDDISKGIFTLGGVWAMGNLIGSITGQDEVIPDVTSGDTYSSPALQFIFGSNYKTGLLGVFTSQSGDKYDEAGNNLTQEERRGQFLSEVLPGFLVPGMSQMKRTAQGLEINEQGYSETDSGNIRYMADPDRDTQRAIFGQYSTPEGREYIENMNKPTGGSMSPTKSDMIRNAPEQLRNQYYEFFKAADQVTGRGDASKEVTKLFQEGRTEAARRKADEFNAKVDEALAPLFENNSYIDEELQEYLSKNEYITLTPASEAARARSQK